MQPGSILAEIERLNWSLAAVTGVMRVLVRAKTEHELFLAACEAVTRQNFYDLAWIGLPRQDVQRSVLVGARAGAAISYLDDIQISWGDVPLGRGPTGTAIRSGRLQICNVPGNPILAPWLERMARYAAGESMAGSLQNLPEILR